MGDLKEQLTACKSAFGNQNKDMLQASLGCNPSAPEFRALSGLPSVELTTETLLDKITGSHKATTERALNLLQDRIEPFRRYNSVAAVSLSQERLIWYLQDDHLL